MKGSLVAILVRCLWLSLALLASSVHGGPVLSQPRGEKFPAMTVDLDNETPEAYKLFLEELRGRLEACRRQTLHVLPPQMRNPTAATVDYFDVGLHTAGFTISVRLQADNLYLLGWRSEIGDQPRQWRILPNAQTLMPADSVVMPFGFTYSRLESAAGLRRAQLPLGLSALRGAVSHLATHLQPPANTDESHAQAKALLVLLQMLCEALRFHAVADVVAAETAQIDERLATLENDWADISEAVLRGDREYTDSTPLLANENQMRNWQLRTLSAAIAALGLALRPPPPGGSGSSGKKRQEECGLASQGRTLLEVYFVRINNIDGEDPGDLYGTITATDALGTETLYRQDGGTDSIGPGQDVPLTGPSRPISGSGAFSIDLDLWDRDSFPDPSPNDPIAQGSIQWNPEDPTNAYDQTHYQQVSGASGSASVQFAVIQYGVTATVTVVLVQGDESSNDVCGTIAAHTKLDKIVMFDRACGKDTAVSVGEGQPVPLRRSVLAVPVDDVLGIEVNIKDWDRISWNDELARGQETFAVKTDTNKTIHGANGRVDVAVNWSEL